MVTRAREGFADIESKERQNMPQDANQDRLTRRQFIRIAAAAGLGSALAACSEQAAPDPLETDVVAAPGATEQATATAAPTKQVTAVPETTQQSIAPPDPTLQATAPSEPTVQATAPSEPTVQAIATEPQLAYLSVARGSDPTAITRAALSAIGGMGRFVKRGDDVIVKPNICVDYRSFEYGATTNPDVVATLVEECLGAGAKRVRVMDFPFGGAPESAFATSGIAAAVTAAGGEMEVMNGAKYREVEIPEGRDITRWPVYQDVLTTDVLIDVPIAKHHSLARLTLAGKNLMGVILNRGGIHNNMGQRVADLVSLVRPTLTVVDAVRTLMAHGPTGGNLDDVRLTNTVVASHDIVAADAYAATLFGLTGEDIDYIRAAADMGLGTLDLEAIKIEEVAV
jgi:uncharacterized protein (DUF362 family)